MRGQHHTTYLSVDCSADEHVYAISQLLLPTAFTLITWYLIGLCVVLVVLAVLLCRHCRETLPGLWGHYRTGVRGVGGANAGTRVQQVEPVVHLR